MRSQEITMAAIFVFPTLQLKRRNRWKCRWNLSEGLKAAKASKERERRGEDRPQLNVWAQAKPPCTLRRKSWRHPFRPIHLVFAPLPPPWKKYEHPPPSPSFPISLWPTWICVMGWRRSTALFRSWFWLDPVAACATLCKSDEWTSVLCYVSIFLAEYMRLRLYRL